MVLKPEMPVRIRPAKIRQLQGEPCDCCEPGGARGIHAGGQFQHRDSLLMLKKLQALYASLGLSTAKYPNTHEHLVHRVWSFQNLSPEYHHDRDPEVDLVHRGGKEESPASVDLT